MKITSELLRSWAKIDSTWDVKESKSHREVKQGTRYQVVWFTATNSKSQECLRYRVWLNEGLSPPYRKQQGWEVFDANGSISDREIRYSKRDNDNYLH